jgi:hypothetical protein
MFRDLPLMKADPSALPAGEWEAVSGLPPEPQPVEEASPQEEVVG